MPSPVPPPAAVARSRVMPTWPRGRRMPPLEPSWVAFVTVVLAGCVVLGCGRFVADAGAAEAGSPPGPGRRGPSASRVLDLPVDDLPTLVRVGPADERAGYAKGQARPGRERSGPGQRCRRVTGGGRPHP